MIVYIRISEEVSMSVLLRLYINRVKSMVCRLCCMNF